MDSANLISSGTGAVIGFALAQLVNGAKLIWGWWWRPKLVIEPPLDNWVLLSHLAQLGGGEYCDEKIYGFSVRNVGRSIATGVRVQLIRISNRPSNADDFSVTSEQAYDLAVYRGAGIESVDTESVLVPDARIIIELAGWRDYGPSPVIWPAVAGLPDYYEESCEGDKSYQFKVVAFDDKANFVDRILTVEK